MKKYRSKKLLEKSISAMISAIDVYNKPNHQYREESFCILVLNAWELLLKARLLHNARNKLSSIQEYEWRQRQNGALSSKRYLKRNRSGNPQTITLGRSIAVLDSVAEDRLPNVVKSNLDGLIEIRDNAIHFINEAPVLTKRVHELATACLSNYVNLVKRWFDDDLSRYNFFLMPIGFIKAPTSASALTLTQNEKNLLKYLVSLDQETTGAGDDDFYVSLRIDLSFHRHKVAGAVPVQVTTDPSATKVILSEEDIRQQSPWDYNELTKRLSSRYSDFKANSEYHRIRRPLMTDTKFVNTRFLDPGNPKSAKKDYYSPNVVQVFDQHYTRV
jgi:Protein of unknown function (DUF3644)